MPQIPGRALAKLNIVSYSEMDELGNFKTKVGRFIAAYNPTTFQFNTGTEMDVAYTAGNAGGAVVDLYKEARKLNVEFFIDGTGASPPLGLPIGSAFSAIGGIIGGGSAATPIATLAAQAGTQAVASAFVVKSYVNYFFKITASSSLQPPENDPKTPEDESLNEKTHQSNYLKVIWGAGLRFNCKLQSANVSYTLFNQLGQPLRATIKATFLEVKKNKKARLQSPDLTKVHLVKAGDTIYNLAKNEYGSESYYLQIAQANDLKNYRKLTPGQTLVLPPIAKTE